MAIFVWDPKTGTVMEVNAAFHFLDQFSKTLFFSLSTVLILFWAEMYYISIDKSSTFTSTVQPLVYISNILVYILLIFWTTLDPSSRRSDYYLYSDFGIGMSVIYLVCAMLFAYYAYVADAELQLVPVDPETRRARSLHVRVLGVVFVSALVANTIFVLLYEDRTFSLVSAKSLVLVFFYYFILEVIPLSVVWWFFRSSRRRKQNQQHSHNNRCCCTRDVEYEQSHEETSFLVK
eukprot:gene5729-11580_t